VIAALAASSRTIALYLKSSIPAPPYFSGIAIPMTPSKANFFQNGAGNSPAFSHSA
jgi:hypothetical protein